MTENLPRGSFARGGESVPGKSMRQSSSSSSSSSSSFLFLYFFMYQDLSTPSLEAAQLWNRRRNSHCHLHSRTHLLLNLLSEVCNKVFWPNYLYIYVKSYSFFILFLLFFYICCQILLQHYADFSRLQSAASVWRCASVTSHKCLDHQLASSGQHCAGHQVISTV